MYKYRSDNLDTLIASKKVFLKFLTKFIHTISRSGDTGKLIFASQSITVQDDMHTKRRQVRWLLLEGSLTGEGKKGKPSPSQIE